MKTQRKIITSLFAFLLSGFFASANSAMLYGLKTTGPFQLYQINTETLGSPQLIGNINYGSDLSGLVRVTDNYLYTFDRASDTLVSVSTVDASVLSTVRLDRNITSHPRGFDLSPEGILYGVFPGLELRTVNPFTGTTTLVANITGAAGVESLAFGSDGTLYASGDPIDALYSHSIYRLNTVTGQLSLLGNTGVDIDALTFAPDGFLYGTDSLNDVIADLIRIDPVSGQSVNLGGTGVTGFNGIAAASAVPVPAAAWLFGSGFIGLIGVARRKAA